MCSNASLGTCVSIFNTIKSIVWALDEHQQKIKKIALMIGFFFIRLDVAKTHKRQADIDWVLQQRQKYLSSINREEYLPAFKQINNQTN